MILQILQMVSAVTEHGLQKVAYICYLATLQQRPNYKQSSRNSNSLHMTDNSYSPQMLKLSMCSYNKHTAAMGF